MGYFPNGTSGMAYEEQYCDRCAHNQDEENGCPVWVLHLQHNYDEKKRTLLNVLIPMADDGITNLECRMFIEAERVEKSTVVNRCDKCQRAVLQADEKKSVCDRCFYIR